MNGRRRTAVGAIAGLASLTALVMSGPAIAVADPEHASTGPDAAQPGGRTVYVTNSGALNSGTPNVSRFTVDAAGRLTQVGRPVDTGAGPRGMVITPDLRFAYVVNMGSNSVSMYHVGAGGALIGFGEVETGEAPMGIAIAPDGRTVYVANREGDTLSVFAVGSHGMLTPQREASTGAAQPKDVAVTPDGRFLYVSHGALTDTDPDVITGFALGSDGRPERQVAEADIGASGAETAITPDGRFLYVMNQISNDVHGFRIGRNGALTSVPGSPVDGGNFPEGAAISPDGRRLYVAAVGVDIRDGVVDTDVRPGQVLGFTIGNDGRLTETVDRVTMSSPIAFGFTPDGRRVYVSDFTDSIVNTFAVARDGNLRLIQTVKSGGPRPGFQSVTVLPTRYTTTSR